MPHLRFTILLATALSFGAAFPAFATNYAVGTCRPTLTSYPTISAAVSTVPAGSIVEVCPGTYAEQVTISQPVPLADSALMRDANHWEGCPTLRF
jgi:hypothetical protein